MAVRRAPIARQRSRLGRLSLGRGMVHYVLALIKRIEGDGDSDADGHAETSRACCRRSGSDDE